jgi:digeranylgeranylglycerophospholipid reductase
MDTRECDILVIGAGPAGSSAAFAAAAEGFNVLVIEQKALVGVPVRCAEYIPAPLLRDIDSGRDFIVQPVRYMRTMLPDGHIKDTSAPGFMIRRDVFDQVLARKAEEAGAAMKTGIKAISINKEGVLVRGTKEAHRIKADIVIGADGPHSRVGRWIGSRNRNLIPGVQVTAGLVRPMDFTEVYFDKELFGGYGWLFPKGEEANIGIAMRKTSAASYSFKKCLERFISRLKAEGKISGKVSGYTAGWIPAERHRGAVWKNIMLAGDAAGQTHPISGAGTAQAVTCGGSAGKWAARAIRAKDMGLLSGYDIECWELYGESRDRAFHRRELMEKEWDHLEDMVERCWIGFREYYA